jgi:hypothetical protein
VLAYCFETVHMQDLSCFLISILDGNAKQSLQCEYVGNYTLVIQLATSASMHELKFFYLCHHSCLYFIYF